MPTAVHTALEERVVLGFVRASIYELSVLKIPPKLELTVIVKALIPAGVTPVNAAEKLPFPPVTATDPTVGPPVNPNVQFAKASENVMVNAVGLTAVYARLEGEGGVTVRVVDADELVFPDPSAAVTKNV